MTYNHQENIDNINRAFYIGIALNTLFVLIEVTAGLWLNSMSLLTDAGHNISDVVSLLMAFMAIKLTTVKPNQKFTYGYKKSTVLVALLNSLILLIAIGAIGYEAIMRFNNPVPIEGKYVAITAFIGILINGITAFLFMKGKDKDVNVKGAYLHLLADALVSVGVVVAGVLIAVTDWLWIDSVVSLAIIVVIFVGTWKLLTESLRLSLDGVPTGINILKIKDEIIKTNQVVAINDMHIWAMSTSETAFTAHIQVTEDAAMNNYYKIKNKISEILKSKNITHITIEIETESHKNEANCAPNIN